MKNLMYILACLALSPLPGLSDEAPATPPPAGKEGENLILKRPGMVANRKSRKVIIQARATGLGGDEIAEFMVSSGHPDIDG